MRIWNIPEQNGRVVDYADVHEMVTAATFAADGTRVIVGTMKGKCRFYHCAPSLKLEYEAQIGMAPVVMCSDVMIGGRPWATLIP